MSARAQYWTATMLWRWQDAPAELRALIPVARRGLWVAVVPAIYAGEEVRWMKHLGPLVSRHSLSDGDTLLIGAEPVAE